MERRFVLRTNRKRPGGPPSAKRIPPIQDPSTTVKTAATKKAPKPEGLSAESASAERGRLETAT